MSFLNQAPAQVLQQSLKNLELSFNNFISKRPQFTRFHRRGHNDTFRYPAPQQFVIDDDLSRIKLPKLGWLRYHNRRPSIGAPKNIRNIRNIRNITVTVEADGSYISIQTEIEVADPKPAKDSMIGVYLGVVRFVTTSAGEVFAPFNNSRKFGKKLIKLQKSILRKYEVEKKIAAKKAKEKKNGGSQVVFGKKHQKARTKLAKHHKRIADLRKDNVEKVSTSLSKNHALGMVVVVEGLKVKNRSASASGTLENLGRNDKAKSGLPKAILNQGWGIFRVRFRLGQKLVASGGELIKVPPMYVYQSKMSRMWSYR